jgi:hypothetical protein
MANTTTQVTPDKQEIKRAEETWANFMRISKVSTIATCGVLALLWLIFIAF